MPPPKPKVLGSTTLTSNQAPLLPRGGSSGTGTLETSSGHWCFACGKRGKSLAIYPSIAGYRWPSGLRPMGLGN
jgi:hypothetical protein